MTIATHAAPFSTSRHEPVTTALLVALFWLAAAVLAFGGNAWLAPSSELVRATVTIGSILAASYAYTRVCARCAGADHALGVGVTWLILAITTEIAITERVGHEWSSLIGNADRPLLRSVLLFVWVFSPALFARSSA